MILPEMPIGCRYCPLEHEEKYVCVWSGMGTLNSQLEKPDFCPLRLLPEKQNICGTYPRADGKTPSYFIGWNDAIKAIEGSGEDEKNC